MTDDEARNLADDMRRDEADRERIALGPSDATDCSGRVLQPNEPIEIGDQMLLVGGSWITVDTPGFLAKDCIEVRRPNTQPSGQ